MSGGGVVAWVSKDDPMFRDDWLATTPLVYSDEHDDSALGPMVGLVLQSDLAAAIARAEAAERDAERYRGMRSVVLSERLDLVPPVPGEKTPDTFDAWIDAAIAAQQAEGEDRG